MPRQTVLVFCLILLFALACQQQTTTPSSTQVPNSAAEAAALRAADEQWSKAANSKNVDATVSFYADDAVVLAPNSPMISDKEQIRSLWRSMIEPAGSSISWKVSKVEVARSGELGYVNGTYEMTDNSSGKPVTDHGKYLEVWKKQADGSWKCTMDMFSSDLPAAPAPAPAK